MAISIDSLSHPLRRSLNDEVHARPSIPIDTPSSVTYLSSVIAPSEDPSIEHERLSRLLAEFGEPPPGVETKHLSAQLGDFQLRWEKHTEFSRYAFIHDASGSEPFATRPLDNIPDSWLAEFQDTLLVAVHLSIAPPQAGGLNLDELSQRYFNGNSLIGANVAGNNAVGLTDFKVLDDGFNRILVLNESMPREQTGRFVQRLLEIETYRMLALLALPVAQSLLPDLNVDEQELADINATLVGAAADDEAKLLERLTVLAARNQSRHAASDFRFSAANAYYDLVLQRIGELRESRLRGVQNFEEFTTRRLTPAIKTCRTVATRQESLVSRTSRSSQLLSTRIDVERQKQSQLLLESVNHRLESQLRLQATVEGISVAAVTYYLVGLVGLMAKGLHARGLPVDPAIVTAIAVPVIAALTFYSVRRIRRSISDG